MVSLSCDRCNDTIKKPKASQHAQRCRSSLTCIDCSKTFYSPTEWGAHNTCISEAEAYQGALYKPTKKELKRKAAEALSSTDASQTKSKKADITIDRNAQPHTKPLIESSGGDAGNPESALLTSSNKSTNQQLQELSSILVSSEWMPLPRALKLFKALHNSDKRVEKSTVKAIIKGLQVRQGIEGVEISMA